MCNKTTESKKEKCVLCWVETVFLCETPIEMRDCYVEGVGQLCRKCYAKLYGEHPIAE